MKPIRGKVTLSGSMRFFDTMIQAGTILQREGYIVHLPFKDNNKVIPEDVLEMYDALHLRKIDESDFLFVVNCGGYIGKSTQREIDYARSINKSVVYLEESKDPVENMKRDIRNIIDQLEEIYKIYEFPVIVPRDSETHVKTNGVITLCGSRKFQKEMDELEINLSKEGNIVYVPVTNKIDMDGLSEGQIEVLHNLHYNKMLMSDTILIVDIDGYVGKDTQREIDFALSNNLNVLYYSKTLADQQHENTEVTNDEV